ncbi:hypothetical protein H1R20_g8513, partial [Candolleomyces eurysporus]
MVDFVSKNAGNTLLYVYVQCDAALQAPVILQAKTILSNASRLKSVVINLQSLARHDGKMLVNMLFHDMIGSADNLEYLKIAAGVRVSDGCEPPFAGGVPSLRYLELTQFRVPWTSHFLQPTCLTHLLMRPHLHQHRSSTISSVALLTSKTLHLELNHKGVEIPSPHDAESSIQLHSLELLEISSTLHIICTLLGRVRISRSNISHLVLDVFLPDEVEPTEGINQFLLAWRHAIGNQHRDPFSPECIRLLKTESIKGEWTYGYAIQLQTSLPTLLGLRYHSKTGLRCSPWAKIKVRSPGERFLEHGEQFPFPNPVAFKQLWSLANLSILILNTELPWSYWPELSLSLVLEAIHIPAANVNGFVEFPLLERWCPPLAPAGPQSVQIAFPALRLFIVGAMANYQEVPDRIRAARRVVDALERRALSGGDSPHVSTSPRLDSLESISCSSEIPR